MAVDVVRDKQPYDLTERYHIYGIFAQCAETHIPNVFGEFMSFSTIVASVASAFMLSAPATASFPPTLVGQWTDNPINCGGEDPSGMRVSGGTISFYEAVGTATAVRVSDNGTITAVLSYTGEGKVWTEKSRFAISPDDKTVRVKALGRTFSLRRCPIL